MRILLINCPVRESAKPNLVPLGVGYIASALREAKHEVDILDINALRWNKDRVEYWLRMVHKDFDMFGISGIITTYAYQKWLIYLIKSMSFRPIVCGGGCASVAGDLLLEHGANKIIKGAGENEMLEYVGSNLRYNNIDEIPFPAWRGFDMSTYLPNAIWGADSGNSSNVAIHEDMKGIRRSVNVVTSRGCPFKCHFCYDLFGQVYQQRSVENVIAELVELKNKYIIDFVGFVDDNMFVSKKWVLKFCAQMKELNLLWGCHARVNEVDEEILSAAFDSGCRWIGYGIESGSQKMLNLMNKKASVDQGQKAIEMTRDAGIYPNTSFIYGFPGESKSTVDETISFCNSLRIKPSFFFAIPYPGSELFKSNSLKIVLRMGGFERFIEQLGDAKDFVINLTDMPDTKFFKMKEHLNKGVNQCTH